MCTGYATDVVMTTRSHPSRPFRLLGRESSGPFDGAALTALAARDVADVRRLTDILVHAHLIERVGGVTPQAYLYGAEFTRESVREDQQRRLDEYINELEKSIDRNAGAQRSLSGEEAVAERGALEGQRRLLEKLRQLKATGRVVLELKPNAAGISMLPDLVLEDGDSLFVPFRPATVNVIGSVYNSNSFVFKPGKTVSDYLRLAGGASKNGDNGRTFVIRADGSSISRQAHARFILSSFTNLRLMPGDTIVVPEKLDKGTTLRGFKDWTQIMGQFVVSAAAAKVLFP